MNIHLKNKKCGIQHSMFAQLLDNGNVDAVTFCYVWSVLRIKVPTLCLTKSQVLLSEPQASYLSICKVRE